MIQAICKEICRMKLVIMRKIKFLMEEGLDWK